MTPCLWLRGFYTFFIMLHRAPVWDFLIVMYWYSLSIWNVAAVGFCCAVIVLAKAHVLLQFGKHSPDSFLDCRAATSCMAASSLMTFSAGNLRAKKQHFFKSTLHLPRAWGGLRPCNLLNKNVASSYPMHFNMWPRCDWWVLAKRYKYSLVALANRVAFFILQVGSS